jgi:hypothetical protein
MPGSQETELALTKTDIIMDDLVLDKTYLRGDKGKKVRLIQEWLCLHDQNGSLTGISDLRPSLRLNNFSEGLA